MNAIDFSAICYACIGRHEGHVENFCTAMQKQGECVAFQEFVKRHEHSKQFKDIEFCCRCCHSNDVPVDSAWMQYVTNSKGKNVCPKTMEWFQSSKAKEDACKMKVLKIMEGSTK